MALEPTCLCVDLGTGGPKVGVVTLRGRVLKQELHAVTTTLGEHGLATQDPGQWWRIISASARKLLNDADELASSVVAVAITGQWSSTVPVDERGQPTGPCVLWLDRRGGRYTRRAIGGPVQGYQPLKVLKWIRRTGGAPSLAGTDPIGHLLHLRHDDAEVFESSRWFLEPVDFLTMQFTGRASASHASMQGAWLTDNRHLSRLAYDADLLALLDLPVDKLAPLVPIGSVIGTVQPSVAGELGIGTSVSVITGLPDLQAAALGSGGTQLYETHLALSTTSWISCPMPTMKTDALHSIATVPGLTNASYQLVDNQEIGAKALEWFRGVYTLSNDVSYDDLCARASTSPAGSRGVIFTPWLAGERSPVDNRFAKAGFANLTLATTSADLVRAVLEGVAYNSRWLLTYVEKFTKQSHETLRLVGGGAQSDLWCQIYADVLQRRIERIPDPMFAQMRGMAMMAGVALGEHQLSDIKNLLPAPDVFSPQKGVAGLYENLAQQVPAIYKASTKIWRAPTDVSHPTS